MCGEQGFLRGFCQLYRCGLETYIQISEKKKTFQDPKKNVLSLFLRVLSVYNI
jgi:hypothetical protein